MSDETVELLAAYAHEAWSGWMEYMFDQCRVDLPGNLTIPAGAVTRWQRQMNTPYADLSEAEKASDRDEARKILAIIETQFSRSAT